MRYLFVGDPHAEPHDLRDCLALARYVIALARQHGATLIIAGDLYHTHAIIHAEVQLFWWTFFEACKKVGVPVITIKGNHDAPGTEGSKATSLLAHTSQCTTVLHEPYATSDGLLFCPYTSGQQLVEWARYYASANYDQTLFCHQTFDGSVYENGFFAGDGVDPNLLPQSMVISGHIHTPQAFGKVWYPGAPRWRVMADANVARAVWLLEFDNGGRLVKKTAYDTGRVCRQILHQVDSPQHPLDAEELPAAKDELHVDIRGPQAWLDARRPLFEPFARVRCFRTDAKQGFKVRESDGVGVAFGKWLEVFEPPRGTEKPVLKKMSEDRLNGI